MADDTRGKRDHRSGADRDGDGRPPDAGEGHNRRDAREDGDVSPPGRIIGQVAKQGIVSRAELLASGVSRHGIDRRARDGELHRRHRGVYLVGHEALAPTALEHAALLACGERAVLSHGSAAYVWGMINDPPECVHITLVACRRRAKRGVSIHTVRRLDRRDVTRKAGLLLTSPARTLIDFGSTVTEQELAAALAEARVNKQVSPASLEQALARSRGRPGVRRLRDLLGAEREPAITRSEAERRLRRVLGAARLPMPRFNVRVGGYTVDAFWSDCDLIVEVDGYRFHGHRAAFERDRAKDAALVAAGHRVIRVTWRQLTREPIAFVAAVGRALGPGV